MASRDAEGTFDWSKTWIAEMFMSGEDATKHQARIEQLRGLTPDEKRRREIKGGIITGSVGLALMIVIFVLMNGIVATGRVSDAAAEILLRLWIVGVIPVLIGAALIFNGLVVSRSGKLPAGDTADEPDQLGSPAAKNFLSPADTNDLANNVPFSVTDRTTRHLQKTPRGRDE